MSKLALTNISQLIRVPGFAAKKGKEMSNVEKTENACVLIDGEIIADFGLQKDIPDLSGYEVLDCTGKTVLPGFVDSHTHLVFGGYRADEFNLRQSGASYMEIMNKGGGIQSTVNATAAASEEDLEAGALKRLNTALCYGVTTMESKSGYGLDCETELKQLRVMKRLNAIHPIDIVPTYMGAHAIPKNTTADEYISFIIENMLDKVKEENLAEFCDVFCEPNVFTAEQSEKLLKAAISKGLKGKIHADEIVNDGGSGMAAKIGCASADHLLRANDADISALSKSNTVATLLPLTAFCLKEHYAPARKMIDCGCAVALATDLNPGSCFCQSIPLLIALSAIYMSMTAEEIVTALTLNAAAAVGRAHEIGSIDKGKFADMIILEWDSINYLPYRTATSSVETVIKKGKTVFHKEG
jgi:imidazolonepropionase